MKKGHLQGYGHVKEDKGAMFYHEGDYYTCENARCVSICV